MATKKVKGRKAGKTCCRKTCESNCKIAHGIVSRIFNEKKFIHAVIAEAKKKGIGPVCLSRALTRFLLGYVVDITDMTYGAMLERITCLENGMEK